MSLRYVWSKWDVGSETTYTRKDVTKTSSTVVSTVATLYRTCLVETYTGKITLSNSFKVNSVTTVGSGFYKSGSEVWYVTATYNDTYLSVSIVSKYEVTAAEKITSTKGTTQYDNVSGTQSTYNSNGVTGDYWYILLGSDTIDPSALTMTGEVKAGSQVTLTITPSATIAYGGTVTYTVQTTTDGDNWYDAGTTTDTTMTLTVPEAAAWNARVIASDDTGFTSTTAVYANGSEDLVSVINVGFIPKSGWIGYKNTKNLLLVSATGTAGETVNISASLDGTQVITGSTTSGVSYQLALTDEQFAAVTEGESHTLTVTAQYATSGTSETRTYTFRKFTYDETSEGGVMEGAARAIRAKNGTDSTILGSKIPYEIIQIGAGGTATEADVKAGQTFFTEEGWKTGSAAGSFAYITGYLTPTTKNVAVTLSFPGKPVCVLLAKGNTISAGSSTGTAYWFDRTTGSKTLNTTTSCTCDLQEGSLSITPSGNVSGLQIYYHIVYEV